MAELLAMRKSTEGQARDTGSLGLALSLGDIYGGNATAAGVDDGAAGRGGSRLSPVTPTAPMHLRLVDGERAHSSSASAPPTCFAAASVVLGDGNAGTDALPAPGLVLPPPPAALVPSSLMMLPPPLFSSDDNGAVHGDGSAAAPTLLPPPAPLPASTANAAASPSSLAPKHRIAKQKRRRSGRAANARRNGPLHHQDDELNIEGGLHLIPPFPWSTERVGVHYSLAELSRRGIDTVDGELRCKRCGELRVVALDVRARFRDLCGYISRNIQTMDDRAPARWREPALPDCDKCGQKSSMRPVIAAEKEMINWVFLLLSELLGFCTLEQLKHFCARTQQHRTGAKDRVLYSTYMELCNQLLPNGLFDMAAERQNRNRPNA